MVGRCENCVANLAAGEPVAARQRGEIDVRGDRCLSGQGPPPDLEPRRRAGEGKIDGELEAEITCNPQTNVFKRSGPRMTYSGLCDHVLYDARCKILRSGDPAGEFTFTGLVSGVSGSDITVNGLAARGAGWAITGFVQAPAGAPEDKRLILAQAGDTITLLLPFSIPVAGLNVDVFAGCTHDLAICQSKFDNVINYGGFPFIPRKNPFNSTLRGGS